MDTGNEIPIFPPYLKFNKDLINKALNPKKKPGESGFLNYLASPILRGSLAAALGKKAEKILRGEEKITMNQIRALSIYKTFLDQSFSSPGNTANRHN